MQNKDFRSSFIAIHEICPLSKVLPRRAFSVLLRMAPHVLLQEATRYGLRLLPNDLVVSVEPFAD